MYKPSIVISLVALSILLSAPQDVFGSGCPGSPTQSQGPDVMVIKITGPSNFSSVNGREALTFGADACNLGNQPVQWFACPATTHPVFGGNLYKWSTVNGATRFEQVGQSWLKHGFGADQLHSCCINCQPFGNNTQLGRGCSDAYISTQSAQQSSLGPKYLVNAHTGIYPAGACSAHPTGGNTGRLEVEIADLAVTSGGPGASVRFFSQFHYITADDAAAHNQNNNASSRELTVSGGGTAWTFALPAAFLTQPETPALRLWKTIDSDVSETDVDTPEDDGFPGLVILAAKATDLDNGFWHYEYAVGNLNSDRSIGAFSVPCSPYATVQNIGFRDVDYHGPDGFGGVTYERTDWLGIFAGGTVSWATTPYDVSYNANAIRWGTQYNFRFDADIPPAPTSGTVTLQEFKVIIDVPALTIVPSSVSCMKGDVNGDGIVNGADIELFEQFLVSGGATPLQKCAGDVQAVPNGSIDDTDVDPFVDCVLNDGCP